jgi:hypothetical protein
MCRAEILDVLCGERVCVQGWEIWMCCVIYVLEELVSESERTERNV